MNYLRKFVFKLKKRGEINHNSLLEKWWVSRFLVMWLFHRQMSSLHFIEPFLAN